MNKHARVTPTNRLREYLVRLANDTEWGEHLARWIGKAAGGVQFRLLVKSSAAIPWTPLIGAVAVATVALVT